MARMSRSVLLLLFLMAGAVLAAAQQSPDPHLAAARTRALAGTSAFVHGYLHGYEEGFHLADLDLQMGRGARDLGKCKQAHDARGYRRSFGDKRSFQHGYRQGVRVGYADGIAGRAFRAVRELESAAGLAAHAAPAHPDPVFDKGFSAGYTSGQTQGLHDGRRDASLTPPLPGCPPLPAEARDPQTFCAAYIGGYRMGYSDGFTNVSRRAQAEARRGQ
jgi:hypothetical protein